MADQDFQIKIVTTADTSGIRDTSAQLDALRSKIPSAALGPGYASALTGGTVPAELLGDVATETERAAASSRNWAAGLSFAGAHLTRARQEALVLARELETGGNVTRTLGSLLGSLGTPITLAALGGLAIFEAFKHANEQVAKMIGDASKLGDDLQNAAKKWETGIGGAISGSEVQKVAEQTLPELERIHAKVQQIQQEDIGLFAKAIDALTSAFAKFSPAYAQTIGGTGKAYKDALDAAKALATQEEEAARIDAERDIERAERFKKLFEQRAAEPLSQALHEVVSVTDQLKAKQQALNVDAEDFVEKYVAIGKEIENSEKQLRGLVQADKERLEFQKANAANLEDQTTEAQRILQNLEHSESTLKALGVDASDLAAAFALGERTSGELGKAIRNAATEAAKARAEAKQAADEAAGNASPQVKAILANERAAAQARKEGRDRDAELYEKSARELEQSPSTDVSELSNIRNLYRAPGPPRSVDEWRRQQEEATREFEKAHTPPAASPQASQEGSADNEAMKDVASATRENTGILRQLVQAWS